MALFKAAVTKAAPLAIQLTAPTHGVGYVVGYTAMGDNTFGGASRPLLTRPSTPGTGFGEAFPLNPPNSAPGAVGVADLDVAQCEVVTVFKTAPSLPRVSINVGNLPLKVRWEAPSSQGIVVREGESILLYAGVSGAHSWSGELVWEER